ncbi:hypothetical protein [Pyramidobacter porci]
MHNDGKSFSVKRKLINAGHRSDPDEANWELAQYPPLHYNEIDRMKTRDLTAQCHISFSTVRASVKVWASTISPTCARPG